MMPERRASVPRMNWLGALDPVLEAVRVAHALLACEPKSEQVLGRLDEDGHLVVAVVLAAVVEPCTVEPTVARRIVPCSTISSVVISWFSFRQDTVPEPPRGVEPLRAGSKPAALPTELRRQAGAARAPGRCWGKRCGWRGSNPHGLSTAGF
jgi:hypothetical protein